MEGNQLAGDVDADGCVNDTDFLAVLFAWGEGPHYTGPEDLDGDGWVDDADLLMVLYHFGSYLWTYEYDVWGNLIEANSACAGTYEAGYDALGRRVWQRVSLPNEAPVETYFLYDGDTLIGEVALVGSEWRLVAEYVWGSLGPLMQRRYNPATESWYNYYYVQDGLGHTRLLLDGSGNVVNRYAYDAWGRLIEYEESVPNPFTWNGAYGYEYIPLTGLYHVGAREYDPRTGRWLQRDPIEAASGDPNLWRYCGNDPLNGVDPSGLQTKGLIDPFQVRFSHDSISPFFRDGRPVQELIDSLLDGTVKPEDVSPIRIGVLGGKLWTLDNRRLYAYQRANKPIPYVMVSEAEVAKQSWKFTNKSDGTSIRIRGVNRALGVIGLALTTLSLAEAAGPCGEPGKALGGLGGGIAGSVIGGTIGRGIGRSVGAAIGSSLLPGIGTFLGGALGGLAGGALGDWIGGMFDSSKPECECP